MKSKLFLIPIIALIAIGTSVTAQEKKSSELRPKDQIIDRYQVQKKAGQATFKKDMDAVNDQKNLTPEQKEVKRKQIIASHNQQKKINQETFENNKKALKVSTQKTEKSEKMEEHRENKTAGKHESMAKEHRENKTREHHSTKPHVEHENHH